MIQIKEALKELLEAVEDAIQAGDWTVDGACDPDLVIKRSKKALAEPEPEQEPVGTVKDLFTQAAWERLDVRGSTKVYLDIPPQRKPLTDNPEWIVNDLGELGVKVGHRFFFLYKGNSLEYGKNCAGETALHEDGTPMRYRIVGKREFGETCWPLSWVTQGHQESRYTVELEYMPGLSFGKPEDGEWKPLPSTHGIKE